MMAGELLFRPVFPSPFAILHYGEKHRELNKRLIDDIEDAIEDKNIKYKTFSKNACSKQTQSNMEERYDSFSELRDIIHQACVEAMVKSKIPYEIANSTRTQHLWGNVVFDIGGFSKPHFHGSGRTLWSGVYYPKGLKEIENLDEYDIKRSIQAGYSVEREAENPTGGQLIVHDPARLIKSQVKPDGELKGFTEYYGHDITIWPTESLLVLFPAWLEHMVAPSLTKNKRYSISFATNKRS